MGSKYHEYGRDILRRLQEEAMKEGSSLIWRGPITTLIGEIAGLGNITEMKKRLLEFAAIGMTSDPIAWEVAEWEPDHWDYDSHRVYVSRRPLTKVELRDDMIDRLTQYMTEIRAALDVLVIGQREMMITLDTLANDVREQEPERETYRNLTFEEAYGPASDADEGGTTYSCESAGSDGI